MPTLLLLAVLTAPLEPLDRVIPSDAVVAEVEIRAKSSRWTADHRRIVTEVELEIRESLRGTAPRTVVVLQRGGQVGELAQRVSVEPELTVGQRAVVALELLPSRTRYRALQVLSADEVRQVRGVRR